MLSKLSALPWHRRTLLQMIMRQPPPSPESTGSTRKAFKRGTPARLREAQKKRMQRLMRRSLRHKTSKTLRALPVLPKLSKRTTSALKFLNVCRGRFRLTILTSQMGTLPPGSTSISNAIRVRLPSGQYSYQPVAAFLQYRLVQASASSTDCNWNSNLPSECFKSFCFDDDISVPQRPWCASSMIENEGAKLPAR